MNDRDLSQYEVVREDFISDADGVQLNFNMAATAIAEPIVPHGPVA